MQASRERRLALQTLKDHPGNTAEALDFRESLGWARMSVSGDGSPGRAEQAISCLPLAWNVWICTRAHGAGRGVHPPPQGCTSLPSHQAATCPN